jgi:dsDNA-binding SOS-regulon protein
MAKKKKPVKKKRANKYETKLAITGTLDEVLKASVPKK